MKKVLVIFHSQQYGNTAQCAELVKQGLEAAGTIQVRLINTNEANRVPMADILAADGLAIGTPDYFSYPAGTIKQLFDDLLEAYRQDKPVYQRPCALFLTHGGGGRALEPFKRLAKDFQLVGEPFVCRGEPGDCAPGFVALGKQLGEAVLKG
jgi:multimeric flavodoxin WrbA